MSFGQGCCFAMSMLNAGQKPHWHYWHFLLGPALFLDSLLVALSLVSGSHIVSHESMSFRVRTSVSPLLKSTNWYIYSSYCFLQKESFTVCSTGLCKHSPLCVYTTLEVELVLFPLSLCLCLSSNLLPAVIYSTSSSILTA